VPHKGHPDCIYNSKAACDRARREAMGRCAEMTGDREPSPCTNWAVEEVGGRKVCGQHARTLALAVDQENRRIDRMNELNRRIDAHLAWVADHPHVWDARP
jgi:hypothetical protein